MTGDSTGRPEGVYRTLGPGSRIAGYLIGEQIGAGGMAVVFRARDEVLGRLAAVKVIAPSRANDEEFRARFLRESRMVAAVDSLHIIPVYAAGEAEGLLYIATRFVAGGDLARLVRQTRGRLAPERAAALVTQVASALDAAHAAGLVHRDVKPQNILVDAVPEQPEHAFLSDFGLSKVTQAATRLTAEGQFLGTPDYSAPEQIRGVQVDGRADQYALACVAYVLLTGDLPFSRSDTIATMYAHLQESVPLVTRRRPELPEAVNDVIARALAKAPADRYRRCADFATALQEAVSAAGEAGEHDPWAWLARDDQADRAAAAERGRPRPPAAAGRAGSPGANLASPALTPRAPQAAPDPDPGAGPATPRYTAGFATALKENAGYASPGYANTAYPSTGHPNTGHPNTGHPNTGHPAAGRGGAGGAGGDREPAAAGRPRGRRRQVLIGGAAALLLAAGGAFYAVSQAGGHASASRPSKPTLAATLTVPAGGTIDTVWTSRDGSLIAASGQGRSIYVWSAAQRAYLTTLTAPNIRIGSTVYSTIIDNLAFSTDDSSLTAVVYPNVPSGAPTPGSSSAYVVYRWHLPAGGQPGPPALVWSVLVPTTVAFSNDMSTALTSQNNVVTQVTLAPELNTAPSETVPDGADLNYSPPYELDLTGDRMIYHPTGAETYVWDFGSESVVAKLPSSEYTVLSPDGKTIMAANPSNFSGAAGGTSSAAPTLWEVATRSDVTPSDPRWKEQLREPWQTYSWETYSEDGSVIMTKRAGGKFDLWSTATHKYLLTVTEPGYHDTAFATAVAGGSELVILNGEKTVNGRDEYRQLSLWDTPLG